MRVKANRSSLDPRKLKTRTLTKPITFEDTLEDINYCYLTVGNHFPLHLEPARACFGQAGQTT